MNTVKSSSAGINTNHEGSRAEDSQGQVEKNEDMEITHRKNVRRYQSGRIIIYRIPVECFSSHIVNVYLVLDIRAFLIDTGTDNRRSRKILAEGFRTVREEFHEDITVKDVSDIVITHGHVDHFGMLGHEEFKQKNVYVHENDSAYIKNYSATIDRNLERINNFLRTTGVGDSLREGMINVWHADFESLKPKPVEQPIIGVHDGEKIIDGYQVHHTPGHSPGAICLEVGDFLFVGDHILSDITPHQSPAGLKSGGGLDAYLKSLTKIAHLYRERDVYALPGHGEDIYALPKRLHETRGFHEERLRHIEKMCTEGKNIYDVTTGYFNSFQPEIFAQPDAPDFNKLLAILEISAHIEFLLEEKRLIRVDENSVVAKYLSSVEW